MQVFPNFLAVLFLTFGVLFSGCSCTRAARPEKAALTLPGNAVLLDVRSAAEYQAGHLPGAVNLPHDMLERLSMEKIAPQRSTPVYLYCRSGRRSAMAAEKLRQLQYEFLTDLGGMEQARQKLQIPDGK